MYNVVCTCIYCTCYCILTYIATDNHIGYMEKDPIRGGDSINTFKEILTIAKDKKVI